MTLERACKINDAMCGLYFRSIDVGRRHDGNPQDALAGVSLADMLTAAAMIRAENASHPVAGQRTISSVPDDRLIAAIYTLLHYEAQFPRNVIIKIPVGDGRSRQLAAMMVREEALALADR